MPDSVRPCRNYVELHIILLYFPAFCDTILILINFTAENSRWNINIFAKVFPAKSPQIHPTISEFADGQWYRLTYSQDTFPFNNLEFSLGGDSTGLQGSIVQKYDYYGTRLEAGTYRVVLEMKAKDGTPHYLAAEFDVE